MWLRIFLFSFYQSLADQEIHLKLQMKELEANVIAAAPDKAKQKQIEKSLDAFKKGGILLKEVVIDCYISYKRSFWIQFVGRITLNIRNLSKISHFIVTSFSF